MAGDDRGTYFLPEVGDEVLVAAEDGDPSHLYVLGMLWNGKQKAAGDNGDGDNNTRLIKSRSGHTVRFNDDASKPEVEVKLADGKRILLDQDGDRDRRREPATSSRSAPRPAPSRSAPRSSSR